MELDIGKKLQAARKDAKLTQEQVAELLGVTRQTISNWENERSYPDIISVIKLSDAYHVSLDVLLKGETKMTYYEYLEESTNTVKSNERRNKLMLTAAYLLIWSIAMIVFWVFTDKTDAMGYSLMYLWVLLPAVTIIVSAVIGANDFWGRSKWLSLPLLGMMYMLAEYGTFEVSNMLAFSSINLPNPMVWLAGAANAAAGMIIGMGIRWVMKKKKGDLSE